MVEFLTIQFLLDIFFFSELIDLSNSEFYAQYRKHMNLSAVFAKVAS